MKKLTALIPRKYLPLFISVGAAMLLLVIFGIYLKGKGSYKPKSEGTASTSMGDGKFEIDSFDDFKKLATLIKDSDADEVRLYADRIRELEEKILKLQEVISNIREEDKLREEQTVNKADEVEKELELLMEENSAENVPDVSVNEVRDEPNELQVVKVKSSSGSRSVHVPAGTFAEATLLTGVYAPINSGALPVLLKIDSIGIGPNKSLVPVDNAFVIAKAVGDPNSSRAVLQLDTLSVVKPDGSTVEKTVNGFVADFDGIQGLRGKYVYRIGEVGLLSIVSSGLSVAGNAFASSQTTKTVSADGTSREVVTGRPLKYAAGKAAAGSMSRIADIFEKRLDEIIPAIFVTNGKQITAVFINGVTIDGLNIMEVKNGKDSPYSDVDSVR